MMEQAKDLPAPCILPCRVFLEFVRKSPKKPANDFPMGDVDNYAKAVLDSIQGLAFFEDDKQVTDLRVMKRYAAKGEAPHILMIVGEPQESEDVLDQPDTISIEELNDE